nr:MAG TPA_asm: hypothetical protein [Caudoviricetes sp.]
MSRSIRSNSSKRQWDGKRVGIRGAAHNRP